MNVPRAALPGLPWLPWSITLCTVLGMPESPWAHAESMAVVLVETPASPTRIERTREAVVRAARERGISLLERAEEEAKTRVRAGALPSSDLRIIAQARALIDDGWRAYVRADIEVARGMLERAREVLRTVLHVSGAPRIYADASLKLGAVLVKMGRIDHARDPLAEAARLDPDREVTHASFAPEVVAAYQESRALVGEQILTVRVEPSSARLFIDGAERPPGTDDRGSYELSLLRGPHLIVVRQPGHRAKARIISVADEPVELSLALQVEPRAAAVLRHSDPVSSGRSPEDISRLLSGLLLYSDAESVVLIASVWRSGRPALIGQRCTGSPLRCTAVVEIRYPSSEATRSAAGELWSRMVDARADDRAPRIASDATLWPARTQRERAATRTTGERCRLCRNPWLWAGIGAALTTVGAVLFFSRDGRPSPVITVDPCQFGNCLVGAAVPGR